MKKIALLLAVGMTVFFGSTKAQSFSALPYGGLSVDQSGALSYKDPLGGITILANIASDHLGLGLDMSGGQRYSYPFKKMNEDSTFSTVWKRVNAPALSLVVALNVPRGKFKGPILGLEGGMAFPNIDYGTAGMVKIFTQFNYNFSDDESSSGTEPVWGIFAQGSFNFLYTKRTTYSSGIVIGVRFMVPNVF